MTALFTGLALLGTAAIFGLYDMADTIKDLKDWHGIYEPGFVGPALKSFLSPIVAALGGTALGAYFSQKGK